MHLLYKKQGEICLEALQRLKNELKTSDSVTYAGRLDPLAAGLLIVLEGQDEIADKATYLDLRKTYEFEVVFGVSTDTFDQLGVIVPSTEVLAWPTLSFHQDFGKEDFEKRDFKKLIGKVKQTYPFYSSKPIDGVPLFQYVKDHGIAATIPKLPTNEVEIFDVEVLGESKILVDDLIKESIGFANIIKGDFRQKEISESWQGFEKGNHASDLRIMKFRLTVSSGFYIRSFACWLGQVAGVVAIARNIVRTRVGDLSLS